MPILADAYSKYCTDAGIDPITYVYDVFCEISESGLVTVDLCFNQLLSRSLSIVLKTLSDIKLRVESLKLSLSDSLSEESFDDLFTTLSSFLSLSDLTLLNVKLLPSFSSFLSSATFIKYLNLSNIDFSNLEHLTSALPHSRLFSLSVSFLHVSDAHFAAITTALPPSINSITYLNSAIGSKTTSVLTDPQFLKLHPNLTSIEFNQTFLSNHDVTSIKKSLSNRDVELDFVNFDDTLSITHAIASASISSPLASSLPISDQFKFDSVLNAFRSAKDGKVSWNAASSLAIKRLSDMAALGKSLTRSQSKVIESRDLLSSALNSVLVHRDSLEGKLKALDYSNQNKIKNMEVEIQKLNDQIDQMRDTLDQQSSVNQRRHVDTFSTFTQTEKEPIDLGCKTCNALQRRIKKANEAGIEMRKEIEDLRDRNQGLSSTVDRLDRHVSKLSKENSDLTDTLEGIEQNYRKIAKSERLLRSNNEKLEAMVVDQNESISKLKQKLSFSEQELQNSRNLNECFQSDHVNQSEMISDLNNALTEKDEELQQLLDCIPQLTDQLTGTREELNLVQSEKSRLMSLLKEKEELLSTYVMESIQNSSDF
ncbi:hypothetical protein GEMRC1_011934 [Eukaryota sp. GEM-RC1]